MKGVASSPFRRAAIDRYVRGRRLLSALSSPKDIIRASRWLRDLWDFRVASGATAEIELYPILDDATAEAGAVGGHYFFQDLWAAQRVAATAVGEHVDVGSRIDGFVAHVASFTNVRYVDIRPVSTPVPRIEWVRGSVLALPFPDHSISSLSCLHVLEHIGLGRYGDPIDPTGHEKGLRELARVLAPGGSLFVSVPIGRERVCFNAHRILSPHWAPEILAGFELVAFAAIDDCGSLRINAGPADFMDASYACGVYAFRRSTP